MSMLRVGRGAGQRVAGGVDADGLDQVLQRDDGAGALAHPHRLAVLDQVDQLADQDLEVVARGVAEGGAHGHQPADVAVVVGAEHDDDAVEAALALVEVVGEVAGEVGRLAVGRMMTRSLSSPKSVVRSQIAPSASKMWPELAQPVDGVLDGAGLVQRRSRGSRRRSRRRSRAGVALISANISVDADRAEDLLRLVVGRGRAASGRGRQHLRRRCRRCSRRRSRPRASARPWRAASSDAREPVDLRAVVVEVVLARDRRRPAPRGSGARSRRRRPSGCRRGASGRSGWPRRTRG